MFSFLSDSASFLFPVFLIPFASSDVLGSSTSFQNWIVQLSIGSF